MRPTLFIIVLLLAACGLLTTACDGKVKVETDDAGNVVSVNVRSHATTIERHIERLETLAPQIPAMKAEILSKTVEFRNELKRGRKSSKSLGPLEDRVASYVRLVEEKLPAATSGTKSTAAPAVAGAPNKNQKLDRTGTTTSPPGGKLGATPPPPGGKLGGATSAAPMGGR